MATISRTDANRPTPRPYRSVNSSATLIRSNRFHRRATASVYQPRPTRKTADRPIAIGPARYPTPENARSVVVLNSVITRVGTSANTPIRRLATRKSCGRCTRRMSPTATIAITNAEKPNQSRGSSMD